MHCGTNCLLSHAQLVAELPVPHRNFMVDFRSSGYRGIGDYFVYCKLPGNKSSDCKPGEEFESRIKIITMIKNYFKTASRHLWKNKIFSLINIAGLSIGISSAL